MHRINYGVTAILFQGNIADMYNPFTPLSEESKAKNF